MKKYCISYFLSDLADEEHPNGKFCEYDEHDTIEEACDEIADVFNHEPTTEMVREFFTNGQVGDVYENDDDIHLTIRG